MPRTLFISLLIIIIGYSVRTSLFLLLIKERGQGANIVYQLFVPILYHIYKHLSSDFNTYFKIILYFFTHKREGKWLLNYFLFLLLIKERGNDAFQLFYLLTHKRQGISLQCSFSLLSSHLNQ